MPAARTNGTVCRRTRLPAAYVQPSPLLPPPHQPPGHKTGKVGEPWSKTFGLPPLHKRLLVQASSQQTGLQQSRVPDQPLKSTSNVNHSKNIRGPCQQFLLIPNNSNRKVPSSSSSPSPTPEYLKDMLHHSVRGAKKIHAGDAPDLGLHSARRQILLS